MVQQTLFKSFWQAGFECSTHKLANGRRLDEVAFTQHDRFTGADFARLKDVGIQTVREGIRWHLIEGEPLHYDFASVLPILEAAQQHDIEVIWDLFHFGWPDNYDVFSEQWLIGFATLAARFGRLLRSETSGSVFVAPLNEISFVAWAGGDIGYINPFQRDRGPELKRQLVRAFVRASAELKVECPRVRLVSPEPVIHIVGNPNDPADIKAAAEYRSAMFEAWDMIAGLVQPELGGHAAYLDVLGLNYYDRNQWWNFGSTISRGEPEYRPFREIIGEIYQRYQRPLFISETGTEDQGRPAWLEYIAQEVREAIRAGTPVQGICLYPILNHPGWDDDRHCLNGLWDYAAPDGSREIFQPLADELLRQQHIESEIYDTPTSPTNSGEGEQPTGFDLPVPPKMELRVSKAPAPDESLRETPTCFLLGGATV